jgi:hypothetical protein
MVDRGVVDTREQERKDALKRQGASRRTAAANRAFVQKSRSLRAKDLPNRWWPRNDQGNPIQPRGGYQNGRWIGPPIRAGYETAWRYRPDPSLGTGTGPMGPSYSTSSAWPSVTATPAAARTSQIGAASTSGAGAGAGANAGAGADAWHFYQDAGVKNDPNSPYYTGNTPPANTGNTSPADTGGGMPAMPNYDMMGQQAMDRVNSVYADTANRMNALRQQDRTMQQGLMDATNRALMQRYADLQQTVASGGNDLQAQGFGGMTAPANVEGSLQLQALQNAAMNQDSYMRNLQAMSEANAADRLSGAYQTRGAYQTGILGQIAQAKMDAAAAAAGGGGGGGGGGGSGGGSTDGTTGEMGPSTFNYAQDLAQADAYTPYERAISGLSFKKSQPLLQEMARRLRARANPMALQATLGGKGRRRINKQLTTLTKLYNQQPTINLDDALAMRDAAVAGRGSKYAGR